MSSDPELRSPIESGNQAEVFAYEQGVLKLYRCHVPKCFAFREAAVLAMIETLDVPAPLVLGVRSIEDRWGLILSRIKGQNFARTLHDRPEARPVYMKEMARLHVAIHRQQAPRLSSLKARLGDELQRAAIKLGGALPLQALLDRLAEMPDGDRLCHGDFHPANVMGSPGNASIIDWLEATRGEPVLDVCKSWLLMKRSDQALASDYVEAYVSCATECGRSLVRDDILRWVCVPKIGFGVDAENRPRKIQPNDRPVQADACLPGFAL